MIGETLGSYRVQGRLGQGGMGAVYVGEHQVLGKRAAIKVLLPELSVRPDIVNRFFNEARAAAMLQHPGIVDIYDFGYHASGSAYIAMELLAGEGLGARMKRGGLTFEEIALIARQIAMALSAAHARGIIHRDLKPDNVMLVPDAAMPGGVRVKILDFGIAKLVDESGSSSMTSTGTILGTPYYMSPEQCRGAALVDARADIYSLGCILYEIVCGTPPFEGEGPGEVLGKHQFVEPVPVRELNPGVPAPLEALIMSALAKSPDQRPASMAEVVRALDEMAPRVSGRWAAMTGSSAPAAVPVATATSRPRRAAVLAGGAVAAALLAGGAILLLARGGQEHLAASASAPPPAPDAAPAVARPDAMVRAEAPPDPRSLDEARAEVIAAILQKRCDAATAMARLAFQRWPEKGWKVEKLLGYCPYGGFQPADLLEWARESARHGEHAAALRLCELALERAPIDPAVLIECATAACNLKDAERASRYAFRVSEARRAPIEKVCARQKISLQAPRAD